MKLKTRHLLIVLGDQLDAAAGIFEAFDPTQDIILMMEVLEESTHVRSSKQRSTLFLSAMRHFAADLYTQRQWRVDYVRLEDAGNTQTLAGELARAVVRHQPSQLMVTAPGDWRVLQALRQQASVLQLPLMVQDDLHFFTTVRQFSAHATGRKQLRLEYFYRELRQNTGVLMQKTASNGSQPIGGQWNFDADNRQAFGRVGPVNLPKPIRFLPDETTQAVIKVVNTVLADHPGAVSDSLDGFGWPVTRAQALLALEAFIRDRLPLFGRYEDAMWAGEPWLYHSQLSAALNLKLLNPREVLAAAEAAYHRGEAPIEAVEGFVRQILGWREYVRGIYWTHMPQYVELNVSGAQANLPSFYWTGNTPMTCLKQSITQTLQHGYSHHIQRLMVTGLYALLLEVEPKQVHEWYLSVYVDAVEWVELPNTVGMSQFADGGIMSSKPYLASGKYIQRMSNYCQTCRFNPSERVGALACPFTNLYWDYLIRHQQRLSKNARMSMQLKHLVGISPEEQQAITLQASQYKQAQQA
jgi:deoxyribodipyrimidine photolyase-related protein